MDLCKLCITWLPPPEVKVSPNPRVVQELIVWDSLNHKDYQPAHIKASPIPRLAQELNKWNSLKHNDYQPAISRYFPSLDWCNNWINGTVWTTMTTNLHMSRYHPSLGWHRSWMYVQSKPYDYLPAHIKVSPIPRLVQDLKLWAVYTIWLLACPFQGIVHP